MTHRNAPLTPQERYRLVMRVQAGRPIAHVVAEVASSYYELLHVGGASFRMSKHDLRARPAFHHTRDATWAHLTVVITALVVVRYLQDATGISIAKIVRELCGLQEVTTNPNGHQITAAGPLPPKLKNSSPPSTSQQGTKKVQLRRHRNILRLSVGHGQRADQVGHFQQSCSWCHRRCSCDSWWFECVGSEPFEPLRGNPPARRPRQP